MTDLQDRLRGCLLGLAVGDALGAAVEFQPPGTFPPVTSYRSGGPHSLNPGEWTDDTSMALALADSLSSVGWDLDDQAARYLRWYQEGEYSVNGRCFDIGMQTRRSLIVFKHTGNARTSGSSSVDFSGNGSIMRLAPVPIRFAHLFPDRIPELAELGEQSSIPTHPSPICRSACRYLTVVLAALAHGWSRDDVLGNPSTLLEQLGTLHPSVDFVARGSYRNKNPPEILGGGFVVHCLEAALWAFHEADDFSTAVLRAVNLGDDADTTGAVCGQLAGAYWGERAIPMTWRDGLAEIDQIEYALSGLVESHP